MKRYWLIRQRQLLGLTQLEVSNKVGISRTYYNQIENGERNPSGSVALRIATFFHMDMSYFFTPNVAKVNNLRGERNCT